MKIIDNIQINYSSNNVDYEDSIKFMEKRVGDICLNNEKELIWFLNHSHIYTLGSSSKKNEVKLITDIPVIKTNRGGKITYHGPGQRIIYFMINLKKRRRDIRKFVTLIESSAIELLKEFDLEANTFPERVGIWVTKYKKIKLDREAKIGAIGLRLKKWVTYHGLSFNINPDLEYYNKIDACGLRGYSVTSLKKLGIDLDQDDFDRLYLKYFIKGLKKL